MTVSSSTSFVSYAGNGSLTTFAYTFKIFQDSDLLVTLVNDASGVETTQILTTNYTVTGAGTASGGNVTFTTAPASGTTVKIRRVLPVTQETDYVANDPFPAEAHEDALDKLTMLVQQEAANSDLAISFPEGDVGSGLNNIVPSVVDRAEKLLKFGNDGSVDVIAASDLSSAIIGANYVIDSFTGDGTKVAYTLSANPGTTNNTAIYIDGVYQAKANYSVSGADLTFTTAPPLNSAIEIVIGDAIPAGAATAASAVSYSQGGTGAVTTNVQAKLREVVSVKDFGAIGDGVTDDTAAIQAAIDYTCVPHTTTDAYLQAKKLTFPEGVYIVTKPLVIYGENFIIDGNNATIRKTTNDLPSSTLADQNMNTGGTIDPNVNAVFTASSKVRYATIKNLNIEGLSGTSTPTGMYIYGNENLLQDIRFRDVNVGLHVPEMWTSRVEHVVVRGAASHGIWWDRTRKTGSASSSGTSINFSNCHLFDIGGIGYYFNAIFYATTNAISCDDFEQAYLFQGCFGLNAHFGFESQKTSSTENAVKFTSDTNGQATLDTYDPTAFSQASIYCSGAKIKLFGRLRVNNTVFIQAANDAIVDAKSLFIYPVSGDEYGTSRFTLDDNTSHIYYQPVGVIDGGQYPILHYSSYGETRSADGADYLVSNLTGGAVPAFKYGQNKLRVIYAVTDFDTTYSDQIVVPLSEIDKVIPRYDENSWTGTLLGLRITERANVGVGEYVSIQDSGSGPTIIATGQRAYTTVGTASKVAVTSITIVGTDLVIQLDVTGGSRQNVSCEIYPLA